MIRQTVTPAEALTRLFEVIREEALANPNFSRRMLTAVGCPVLFQGGEAVATADPILVAASGDYKVFHETFATFSEKDLKNLITAHGLATAEDLKGVKGKAKKPGYITLMWDGAQAKLRDRGA